METLKKRQIGFTLFKYIFLDILLYSFVTFLFFFVIFFVNNLLVTIQDNLIKNVSLSLIAKFFLYSIPIVIANAAPYSAFIGALMCLGRFVSDREFLAANSLGVPNKKLFLPTIAAAVFFALLNFFVNDFLIPFTAPKLNDVMFEISRENPSAQIQSFAVKRIQNLVIASGEVSKEGIDDLLVIDTSNKNTINFLSAKKSFLRKPEHSEILLSLEPNDPQLFVLNKNSPEDFEYAYGEKLTYNFLLSEMSDINYNQLGPGQLSSYKLIKKIKLLREEENASPFYLNWYNLELQKKFSIPFGAMFFVFLAYALSRSLHLYNQGVGFVVGLIISVVYWAILMFGQQLSIDKNINSSITAWLPNLLLLSVGIFLILKKGKH